MFVFLQPTNEQIDCLSYPDSVCDAITIVNLFSALSSFCNEIFLKDIYLTDITSPGIYKIHKKLDQALTIYFIHLLTYFYLIFNSNRSKKNTKTIENLIQFLSLL